MRKKAFFGRKCRNENCRVLYWFQHKSGCPKCKYGAKKEFSE